MEETLMEILALLKRQEKDKLPYKDELYWTIDDITRLLRMKDKTTVKNMLRAARVPSRKVGHQLLVEPKDFLKAHEMGLI